MSKRFPFALLLCLSAAALLPADAAWAQPPAPPVLAVRAEVRERMEGFDGLGFNDTRDDLYWLTRVRVNATVTPSKVFSFQAQVQDARVARKTVGPTGAPFKASFDLRTAFADIGAAGGRVTVRVGRQELVYGEQRLVGHVSWLNAARTFDAVKATVRTKAFQVSDLGLIEMTRQRVRPSLYQSQTRICPCCGGSGRVFTPETVVRRIQRAIRRAASDPRDKSLEIRVHPEIAVFILEDEPAFLKMLEKDNRLRLNLRDDPLMLQDEFRLLAGPGKQDVTQRFALG